MQALQGVGAFRPQAGALPAAGVSPTTWATTDTGMTGMLEAIMPIIVLMMMMGMLMPMMRGITGPAK